MRQEIKVELRCVHCQCEDLVRFGVAPNGSQRYRCKSCLKTFVESYKKEGYKPEVKNRIIEMAIDGVGVRATARLLGVDQNTVMSTLRKKSL